MVRKMNLNEQIAEIASLMGDKTRSSILIALMAGKALTAGELALRANISAQTASNHLKKLLDAKLIELIKPTSRYRYYKISSPMVAKALESLSVITCRQRPPKHEKLDPEICFARSCYDHLAGTLGVKITAALLENAFIQLEDEKFLLTQKGKDFFTEININYRKLLKGKREFAKPCLDWTEREYHLAGSLGSAFLEYLFSERLLIRSKTKNRVVILTEKGCWWIKKYFSITC